MEVKSKEVLLWERIDSELDKYVSSGEPLQGAYKHLHQQGWPDEIVSAIYNRKYNLPLNKISEIKAKAVIYGTVSRKKVIKRFRYTISGEMLTPHEFGTFLDFMSHTLDIMKIYAVKKKKPLYKILKSPHLRKLRWKIEITINSKLTAQMLPDVLDRHGQKLLWKTLDGFSEEEQSFLDWAGKIARIPGIALNMEIIVHLMAAFYLFDYAARTGILSEYKANLNESYTKPIPIELN